MLTHHNLQPTFADRTVVVGAKGFVGGAILRHLEASGARTLALSRAEIDLRAPGAGSALAALLRPTDALVCAAAIAPVKTPAMLRDNLTLLETFSEALHTQPVAHVLNVGSDAIYGDRGEPIDESFDAAPRSLHGIMHLTREVVLSEACASVPFVTLRPTLIYGEGDPHNGYGPNRFRRLAAQGDPISLFGEGEERRDHVWIEDVAELAVRCLSLRSTGALNVATGVLISFREVAQLVAAPTSTSV